MVSELEAERNLERMMEGQEIKRDNLLEEFRQAYSDQDILEEILKSMSKDDIIDYCLECFAEEIMLNETEEFEEYKEIMFREYCNNRD